MEGDMKRKAADKNNNKNNNNSEENKKARVAPEEEEEEGIPEILTYRCYDPLDISTATPILVDVKELEPTFDQIDFSCLGEFINHSLNRHSLAVFDHPGGSKTRFYPIEKGRNKPLYRQFAQEAVVDWYRHNIPGGSRMELKEVLWLNCCPCSDPWYYMTLRLVDEVTRDEKTLQAMVMRVRCTHLLLGLLRDVSENRVIGTIRFKQPPTGATAYILSETLNEDAKKKVRFTDECM